MKNYLCATLLSLLLLPSCGQKQDGSNGVLIRPPISTNTNFVDTVNSAAYFCGEAGCPKSTVAVAVDNLDSLNPTWCTGTVLKNGKVITSKSCFAEYFFTTNNTCQQTVLIKTLAGKVLGCSDFSEVSPELNESFQDPASRVSDYVILNVPELAGSESVEVSQTTLANKESVSLWYINQFESSGLELSLEVKKCTHQNGSLISPWKVSSHIMLSNCSLPDSASGSAILVNNQIAGVVHTLSKDEDLDLWNHRVLEGETLAHYALGNTLDCSTLNPNDVPAFCEQKLYTDSELSNQRADLFTHIEGLDVWEAQIKEFAQYDDDKYLKWDAQLRYDNANLMYVADFIPVCFKDPKKWLEEFRTGLFNMFYAKTGNAYKSWPQYEIYAGLDKNFMLKTSLFDKGEFLYRTNFNPHSVKHNSRSTLYVYNQDTQKQIVELIDVPVCK